MFYIIIYLAFVLMFSYHPIYLLIFIMKKITIVFDIVSNLIDYT